MNNRKEHYCIYIHINTINNKVYIGQTQFQDNLIKRTGKEGEKYHDSPRFYNAIKKYGWQSFQHQILEKNLTKEQANQQEIYWINYYNSTNDKYGYNIQTGGNQSKMSDETKAKISITKKNNYHPYRNKHLSQEHKIKISEALKGEKNHFYGKKHTKETRQIMSLHHADFTGSKNPNAKKVYCKELDLIFNSFVDAALFLGKEKISGSINIRQGINKRGGYAYGYHWERR